MDRLYQTKSKNTEKPQKIAPLRFFIYVVQLFKD